jgi:hypothetical protein
VLTRLCVQRLGKDALREESSLGMLRRLLTILSLVAAGVCVWMSITNTALLKKNDSFVDISMAEGRRPIEFSVCADVRALACVHACACVRA